MADLRRLTTSTKQEGSANNTGRRHRTSTMKSLARITITRWLHFLLVVVVVLSYGCCGGRSTGVAAAFAAGGRGGAGFGAASRSSKNKSAKPKKKKKGGFLADNAAELVANSPNPKTARRRFPAARRARQVGSAAAHRRRYLSTTATGHRADSRGSRPRLQSLSTLWKRPCGITCPSRGSPGSLTSTAWNRGQNEPTTATTTHHS